MERKLKLSNYAIPVLAFGGAGISQIAGLHGTALLCMVALGLPAMFSLVTLPVEFNASRRALQWLEAVGIAVGDQYAGAKSSLLGRDDLRRSSARRDRPGTLLCQNDLWSQSPTINPWDKRLEREGERKLVASRHTRNEASE